MAFGLLEKLREMGSCLSTKTDRKGTRGAVLAEFTIAAVPLLTMFFTFTQAAFAYTANMMLQHAAMTGARAAAVILPPNPGNVGTEADVDAAVKAALGRWATSFPTIQVKTTPAPRPYELVTVEVTATYKCGVPLGGRVMCGGDALLPMKPIRVQYPNQGAEYQ